MQLQCRDVSGTRRQQNNNNNINNKLKRLRDNNQVVQQGTASRVLQAQPLNAP